MDEGALYVKHIEKTYSKCPHDILLSTIKLYESLIENNEYSRFRVMYIAAVKYFYSLINKNELYKNNPRMATE